MQYVSGTTQNHVVDFELRSRGSREESLALLKKNLLAAQSVMKQNYDKRHTARQFEVYDFVYLKLQKYKHKCISTGSNPKLAARYYCLFKVLEHIGEVAYRLELPLNSSVHSVFHVSKSKKHVGSDAKITFNTFD